MTGLATVPILAVLEGLHLSALRPTAVLELVVKAFVTMPIVWILLTLRVADVIPAVGVCHDQARAPVTFSLAEQWSLVGITLATVLGVVSSVSALSVDWIGWLPLRACAALFCLLQLSAVRGWLADPALGGAARAAAGGMLVLVSALSVAATLLPLP